MARKEKIGLFKSRSAGQMNPRMNKQFSYPKIGIRPTIDGLLGGVSESLEQQTMGLVHTFS